MSGTLIGGLCIAFILGTPGFYAGLQATSISWDVTKYGGFAIGAQLAENKDLFLGVVVDGDPLSSNCIHTFIVTDEVDTVGTVE